MAENTNIEWADHTFNPWVGCTKINPACDNCYAEGWSKRSGRAVWGAKADRQRTTPTNWQKPIKWNKALEGTGKRQRVFCASLADVFDNHKSILPEWRLDLWQLIKDTPNLDWLLLTKRPQNIEKYIPEFWDEIKGHVWLGTTVEDQKRADMNIPHLLKHDCAVRFVSCEPLLGPIDLMNKASFSTLWLGGQRGCGGTHTHSGRKGDYIHGELHNCNPRLPHHHHDNRCNKGIDWVIAGGESGPNARPSNPEWFRSLRDQCADAAVPFLFKQWGEYRPVCPHFLDGDIDISKHYQDTYSGQDYLKVGKKKAGRLLDGKTHNEFPKMP